MSSGSLHKLWHSLAFRLTVLYAVIFAVSSFAAFFFFYLLISSTLEGRADKDLLNEIDEFSSFLAVQGIEGVKTAMVLEAESEGVDKMFLRLLDSGGLEISSSNMTSWGEINGDAERLCRLKDKRHAYDTIPIPGRFHDARVLTSAIGSGTFLQIGQSLEDDERFLEACRGIFGVTITILMVFGAFVGWLMAKRALAGVEGESAQQ